MIHLRHILFASVLIFAVLPSVGLAFEPVLNQSEDPFFVFALPRDIETTREYYGELPGNPHLYEATIGEPAELSIELYSIRPDKTDLSGIVVEVRDNGSVREVGRLRAGGADWEPVTAEPTGETFYEGPQLDASLAPGTYRLEVNTPDNSGKYRLVIGTNEPESGYFETIGEIWTVKQFLGRSIFGMLTVPLVYLPFAILLVLLLIYFTWRSYQRTTYA